MSVNGRPKQALQLHVHVSACGDNDALALSDLLQERFGGASFCVDQSLFSDHAPTRPKRTGSGAAAASSHSLLQEEGDDLLTYCLRRKRKYRSPSGATYCTFRSRLLARTRYRRFRRNAQPCSLSLRDLSSAQSPSDLNDSRKLPDATRFSNCSRFCSRWS